MNEITSSARNEALQSVLPFVGDLKDRILDVLRADPIPGHTAEELHYELGKSSPGLTVLNVRSRTTELFKDGKVTPKCKRKNFAGTLRITVWEIVTAA